MMRVLPPVALRGNKGVGSDFIVAKYYASQSGLKEGQVQLWTGKDKDPAAAIHLLKDADWVDLKTITSEEVWLIESEECSDRLLAQHEHANKAVFPSDLWLSGWTVHVAKVTTRQLTAAQQVPEGESGPQARRGALPVVCCFSEGQTGALIRVEDPSPSLRLRPREEGWLLRLQPTRRNVSGITQPGAITTLTH